MPKATIYERESGRLEDPNFNPRYVGFEGKVLTVPQWAAFMLRRLLKETSFTRRISLCL